MPHLQWAANEMVASLIHYYRAARKRFKHFEPLDVVYVRSYAIHDRLPALVRLLCLHHSICAVFRKESHDSANVVARESRAEILHYLNIGLFGHSPLRRVNGARRHCNGSQTQSSGIEHRTS